MVQVAVAPAAKAAAKAAKAAAKAAKAAKAAAKVGQPQEQLQDHTRAIGSTMPAPR